MSARPEAGDRDRRLNLLDSVIYADGFDCALTLEELWRYGRTSIDPAALRRVLRDDPALCQIVIERDGLYCLADRPELLDQRPIKIRRARQLQHRARRVARALRHVPFVRGVFLTGSAAADHASESADLDLMVIVARSRLATVFLMLGSASRLLGRRLFCPNYYVAEGYSETRTPNLYVARELAQARVLAGHGSALVVRNPWLTNVFPNAAPDAGRDERGHTRLQRLLEVPLRGAFGDRLERRACRIAIARLGAHYRDRGEEIPPTVVESLEAGDALRFHAGKVEEKTLRRYAARRTEVAARLASLEREGETANSHGRP